MNIYPVRPRTVPDRTFNGFLQGGYLGIPGLIGGTWENMLQMGSVWITLSYPTGWYWDVFPTVSKQMMIRVSLGNMIWLQMRNALAVWFKHKTFRSGLIWLKTICWTLVSVLKPVGEQHGRGHSVQRPIWPVDSSPTDPWNNQIDIDEASDWEWGRVSFVQFLKVRRIKSQAYGRMCKNTSTLDASGEKETLQSHNLFLVTCMLWSGEASFLNRSCSYPRRSFNFQRPIPSWSLEI